MLSKDSITSLWNDAEKRVVGREDAKAKWEKHAPGLLTALEKLRELSNEAFVYYVCDDGRIETNLPHSLCEAALSEKPFLARIHGWSDKYSLGMYLKLECNEDPHLKMICKDPIESWSIGLVEGEDEKKAGTTHYSFSVEGIIQELSEQIHSCMRYSSAPPLIRKNQNTLKR